MTLIEALNKGGVLTFLKKLVDGGVFFTTFNKSITPTVAGTSQSTVSFNSTGATESVLGARITVNALDDVTGAESLTDVFPDVEVINVGETIEIYSETALTTLYIVGVCSVIHATASQQTIGYNETDALGANKTIDQMTQFDFEAVDDVRKVVISLTPTFTPAGTGGVQYSQCNVEGFSNV